MSRPKNIAIFYEDTKKGIAQNGTTRYFIKTIK
jgi:hypothetical protein